MTLNPKESRSQFKAGLSIVFFAGLTLTIVGTFHQKQRGERHCEVIAMVEVMAVVDESGERKDALLI